MLLRNAGHIEGASLYRELGLALKYEREPSNTKEKLARARFTC